VHRMPDERMVKKIYEWKPMAIRSWGRPQTRWENDVKNDLNIIKIYNWKDCMQDRQKWKKIVENVKTSNYWSCRAWRRRKKKNKNQNTQQLQKDPNKKLSNWNCNIS
jgi:hypothetical protein